MTQSKLYISSYLILVYAWTDNDEGSLGEIPPTFEGCSVERKDNQKIISINVTVKAPFRLDLFLWERWNNFNYVQSTNVDNPPVT